MGNIIYLLYLCAIKNKLAIISKIQEFNFMVENYSKKLNRKLKIHFLYFLLQNHKNNNKKINKINKQVLNYSKIINRLNKIFQFIMTLVAVVFHLGVK